MTTRDGGSGSGQSAVRPVPPAEAERAVRERRERLWLAIKDLRDVLAGPAEDGDRWHAGVRASVENMHATLTDHVRDAESPGGLVAQIFDDSPWLARRAEGLMREHVELLEASRAVMADCRRSVEPQVLRDHAADLLGQVSQHRHRAADLLFDAYALDLSAGD